MPRRTSGRLRKMKQRLRREYTCDREDQQLAGHEPTTPAGAIKPERVDPATQGCQQFPDLVRQALRESWETPDSAKPAIIAELLAPFYSPDTDPKLLLRLAKTLLMLDQYQWERSGA